MSSQKEFLEESRDFWSESIKYDKKQFLASFAIAATGLTLAGVGVGTVMGGDVMGGLLELGFGGGLAIALGKQGLDEVQDFADMTAQTAIRQNEIDQLAE
jgi:preprotein translocase subunit Sss1